MDADAFPPLPLVVLEALEALYPEQEVLTEDTLPELMYRGGQRALVRWLREVYTAQNTPVSEASADQDPDSET